MCFQVADQKPADNLTKLADIDVDDLVSKTRGISNGVLFNVWQSLLKEWGPDSLGVLWEDTMQELLTEVTFQDYHYSFSPRFGPNSSTLVLTYHLFFVHFLLFSGLKHGAHLKHKAAQLRHEGLGKIKIALAGADTSSLLWNSAGALWVWCFLRIWCGRECFGGRRVDYWSCRRGCSWTQRSGQFSHSWVGFPI